MDFSEEHGPEVSVDSIKPLGIPQATFMLCKNYYTIARESKKPKHEANPLKRIVGILVAIAFAAGCGQMGNGGKIQQASTDGKPEGTPFVLIARMHSLPGKEDALIELSREDDRKVEQGEPGMLLHTFDQDPDDALGFVWTEVYASSEAFEYHLKNPNLIQYLEDTAPLTDSFTVEVYGSISETAWAAAQATGVPFRHFKTQAGYIRDLTP